MPPSRSHHLNTWKINRGLSLNKCVHTLIALDEVAGSAEYAIAIRAGAIVLLLLCNMLFCHVLSKPFICVYNANLVHWVHKIFAHIGLIFPCLSSHHQCTRVKHTAQLHYFVGGSRSRQEVQPSDVESVNGSSRESKTSRRRESQIPTCRRCIRSQGGSCLLSFQFEVISLSFVDCNVAKVKKTPQSPHETHCNNQ